MRRPRCRPARRADVGGLTLCVVLAFGAVGCGGAGSGDNGTARAPRGPASAELRQQLAAATTVAPGTFPAAHGRSVQEIADAINASGPEMALASASAITGDHERVAFGLVDPEGSGFVYAPTAVYIARGDDPALGPYAAPPDLLVTDPPFRSRTAAAEDDQFAAIYDARVTLDKPGRYRVLAVSKIGDQLVGSGATLTVSVAQRSPIPRVGQPAPRVATDTVQKARGDIESIDTRVPPDTQHDADLADVVGKRPVALLFATPQLCQSRVCGPVVDIAKQLKRDYGDRITFIHQEVYVANDPEQGLRRPLEAFALPTEPWLFTLDARGRVAARLEGSFGFNAFKAALDAALR